MILLVGLAFWVLALLLVGRVASAYFAPAEPRAALRLGLGALVVLGGVILFRPHQEVFGGEDIGAYLNSAVIFAREGTLFPNDPMLTEVPAADQNYFLYRPDVYGATKDGVLWIRQFEPAQQRPYFQPAFSLLLSAAVRVLGRPSLFYVAPLFTLLTAWTLGGLARPLLGSGWAALAVMLFYLVSPLSAWLGRYAVAETAAGFFFYAGLTLLLRHALWPRARAWPDVLLGSVGMALAPFFHITIWFALLPLAALLLLFLLRGRLVFALFFWVAGGGVLALLWQTRAITDPYKLALRFGLWMQHPWYALLLTVAGGLLVTGVGWLAWRRGGGWPVERPASGGRWGALAFSLVLALVFVVLYFVRGETGLIPGLPAKIYAWLRVTDFRGVALLLSRPLVLAGLLGWLALFWGSREEIRPRLWLAWVLLPGVLFMGWMDNYMLDTRRLLMFFLPLLAVCLAALVAWLTRRRRGWLAAGLTTLLVTLAVHNRAHFFTLTEYRGLLDYFRPFAESIVQEQGCLFTDYTRFGAVLNHYFGIPTLSVHNEEHADCTVLEKTMVARLQRHPEQAVFFLTPFQTPLGRELNFQRVQAGSYAGPVLKKERRLLPRRIESHEFTLQLYRVTLSTASNAPVRLPFRYQPDIGNLGLRGFANVRNEGWSVRGLALTTGVARAVSLSAQEGPPLEADGLYLFFHGPYTPVLQPQLIEGLPEGVKPDWIQLSDAWWVLRLRGPTFKVPRQLRLSSPADGLLSDVQVLCRRTFTSAAAAWPAQSTVEKKLAPIRVRWTRAVSAMVLPAPSGPEGELYLYFAAPEAVGPRVSLHAMRDEWPLGHRAAMRSVPTGSPQWQIYRAGSIGLTPPQAGVILTVAPPWNCGLRGFPSDLGLLLGYAVVTE